MCIYTGFETLDAVLGGLAPGEVMLLAGRPSSGLTSFAVNVTLNVALGIHAPSHTAGLISLEESRHSIYRRLVSILSNVPRHTRENALTFVQKKNRATAMEWLEQATMFFTDGNYMDLEKLRRKAQQWKRIHNIELLVIDSLQWIRLPHRGHRSEDHDLRIIASGIKDLAGMLNIPILLTCELRRRATEGHTKESSRLRNMPIRDLLEKKMDIITLLRRPCICGPSDPEYIDHMLAVVDVAKGPRDRTGVVRMDFNEETGRFTEREADSLV